MVWSRARSTSAVSRGPEPGITNRPRTQQTHKEEGLRVGMESEFGLSVHFNAPPWPIAQSPRLAYIELSKFATLWLLRTVYRTSTHVYNKDTHTHTHTHIYIYIHMYMVPCSVLLPPPPPPYGTGLPGPPPFGTRPRAPGSWHLRPRPHPDP